MKKYKMDKKIKEKWVKALRSKKYKQTRGSLKDDSGYCCLGVLCDIHDQDQENTETGWYDNFYFSNNQIIPIEVKKWAKLDKFNPEIKGIPLSEYNDCLCYSFKKIANLIEEYL